MSTGPTRSTGDHRPGTAALLVQLAHELGNLVNQHIALAKLELGQTAKRTGLGVAKIAAFAPLVLDGYGVLNAALALLLRRWLGPAGAVALVGLLNVVVGLVGVGLAARSLRRPVLDDSVNELERTVQTLAPSHTNGHAALERRS